MARHIAPQQGFTLIELITVIVLLGIVSVGISGFISNGVSIFVDVSQRDQLLSQSRFVIERLNRELRSALPNSLRTTFQPSAHCIEFVPIVSSVFYTDVPVAPETHTTATVLTFDPDALSEVQTTGNFAVVYPTSNADVYNTSQQKRLSYSCNNEGAGACVDANGDNLLQLNVTGSFATDSPAKRLYIVNNAVSYCVRPISPGSLRKSIYRHENAIQSSQTAYTSGGVLMADGVVNTLSVFGASVDAPFRSVPPSLSRNGMSYIMLKFARQDNDNEQVIYSSEVHVANVP